MVIPIIYLSVTPGTPARGYWDHGLLDEYLFPQLKRVFYEGDTIPNSIDGAVVVIPARAQKDSVDAINAQLSTLKWCLVILTGDEESVFPWRELAHERMLVWVMSPKQGYHDDASFRLGSGYRVDAPDILKRIGSTKRENNWFFAGQVTHESRRQLCDQLRGMSDGYLLETQGFGQGLSHTAYLDEMAHTKFVPCPSGPITPDSFRLFETLEAGCVPITQHEEYWTYLFGESPPFPTLHEWSELPELMETLLPHYGLLANTVFAWWQYYKRRMVKKLVDDLRSLGAEPERVTSDVTVVIPTTFMPSNPSTRIITETLESVEEQLPESEIFVLFDIPAHGSPEELRDYSESTRVLLHSLKYDYPHAVPILFDEHAHQSLMTREALRIIDTPLLVFVEHDTPIRGEVPWEKLGEIVRSGYANLIRLSHEGRILPEHEYLMLDKSPQMIMDVPLIRTVQWSQRPHIASTAFYRQILEKYHDHQPRFIEHVMYGVLLRGDYAEFRTHIYAPSGDIQRTIHLDGAKSQKEEP